MLFKKHFFFLILSSASFWFVFQEAYFALNIKLGVSPDEIHHYTLSNLYSQTQSIPLKDTISTYQFGPVSTTPYLYHLIMGKSLNLNVFHLQPLLFLRIFNIILSLISLYFFYQLIKLITKDKIIQVCSLIIQTNLLMYVFLSSMVSYDNLINLLSIISTFLLLKFIDKFKRIYLLLIILITLLGTLTKFTYFPLVFIQSLILSVYFKNYINRQFLLKKLSTKEWLVIFPIIFLTIINLNFYLNNYINYKQLDPSPEKVIDQALLQKYNLQFQRNQEAQETIKDRPLIKLNIFSKKYFYQTEGTIFGILGHINQIKYTNDLKPYNLLVIISLILFLLKIKSILKNKTITVLLIISVLYMMIVFVNNYYQYLTYRIFGLALQGRYNFPVLPNLIIIFIYSLLSPFNKKIKILITLLISILFITGGFFWFISKSTPEWYINT